MKFFYDILRSSLFKTSGIYIIGSILNASIPFLLLPILTRHLSPHDYGIVSMFSSLTSIFGIFLGLNLHGAISRAYFEEHINFKEYIFNCLIMIMLNTMLILFLTIVFSDFISKVTSVPKNWIVIAVLVAFFQFIILSTLSIYQVRMEAKKYSAIQLFHSLFNIFLSILLVVSIGLKWEGRILGQTFATTLVGLTCLLILSNWTTWSVKLDYIKHAIKFGVPLIPHALSGIFMTFTDRFIINNMLGTKETGIYTVGLQIGSVIGLLAEAFNKAYGPWLFRKLNQNDEKVNSKIIKFTYLYFVLILMFAIFLGVLSPLITKYLLGKSFVESYTVIIWIALSGAFSGMYYMVVNYIFYVKKTYILSIITISVGIINIPLTYYFVKYRELIGAAESVALINLSCFLLVFIISVKVYPVMPWSMPLSLIRKGRRKNEEYQRFIN